jgi:hypothetical protein
VKDAAQEFWAKIVSDYVPLSAQRVPSSAKMRLRVLDITEKGSKLHQQSLSFYTPGLSDDLIKSGRRDIMKHQLRKINSLESQYSK